MCVWVSVGVVDMGGNLGVRAIVIVCLGQEQVVVVVFECWVQGEIRVVVSYICQAEWM